MQCKDLKHLNFSFFLFLFFSFFIKAYQRTNSMKLVTCSNCWQVCTETVIYKEHLMGNPTPAKHSMLNTESLQPWLQVLAKVIFFFVSDVFICIFGAMCQDTHALKQGPAIAVSAECFLSWAWRNQKGGKMKIFKQNSKIMMFLCLSTYIKK